MTETNKENLTLVDYENEFSYKANKSNLNISFNRIAFIFFIFLMICSIYSIKVFYLGFLHSKQKIKNIDQVKTNFRADIIDHDGNFMAKTVNTLTVGINPNLIINEKKLLINLRLIFPDKDFNEVKKKIKKKKYLRLEIKLSQKQIEKLRFLGEKYKNFE